MDFNEYQKAARKTAKYPDMGTLGGLMYCGLGLGESGEVQGKIKKLYRDGGYGDYDKNMAIVAELGDTLWYISNTAQELGIELDFVASYNLEKLNSRVERGKIGGSGDNR